MIQQCKTCGRNLEIINGVQTCENCDNSPRQKCEVYSRVVGYLRPISQWNKGKQQEFKDRKVYKIEESKSE
jgi:ribonucleoside-triphosphate reductase